MANDWSLCHFFPVSWLAGLNMSTDKKEDGSKTDGARLLVAPIELNNQPRGVPTEYERLTIVIRGLESQIMHDRRIVEETGKDMRATDPPTIPARVNFSNSLAAMHVTQSALIDAYSQLSRLDEGTLRPITNGTDSGVSSNRVHPPVPQDVNRSKEEKLSKKEVNRLMLVEEANKLKEQQQKTKTDETTA